MDLENKIITKYELRRIFELSYNTMPYFDYDSLVEYAEFLEQRVIETEKMWFNSNDR